MTGTWIRENPNHPEIWRAWHKASVERDLEALLSLYAEDAVLEAPLVPMVMGSSHGMLRGRDAIRDFLDRARKAGATSDGPHLPMRWWRQDRLFSVGDTLIWEYPGETPEGEQMDIVEVMRTEGGLIAHHRVYWGWRLISGNTPDREG